ncbi:WAT1-related protein At5g64700-like isoform X1 [Coffea arabica]|uniref:WAT1-related protein n=1 Tax=Coffea arabica TaxID=13443 RepID=A0A6P6TPH4_COFAR|nr:WAT1-related protein At5g64700-like isoform X1 [Coffea arabica]
MTQPNEKMEGYKPCLVAVLIQAFYAGMHMVSKAAINDGMKTCILVFYRQAIAAVFLAPITIFLEWKTAPPLTVTAFIKIFMLSLFGITLSWNLNNLALGYTSAPLAAAIGNTIPVITFFLAVLLRMESFNLKTIPGISKVAGIALCLGGAATIAFFHGPNLRLLVHHHLLNSDSLENPGHAPASTTWIKGVFLMFLAYILWSSWIVFQGDLLKSYPSKLISTTLQNCMSTIDSFVVAISLERDPNEWKLGWNVRLLSVAYCGIVISGITFYLQVWVIEQKGPLFLAIWTPLVLVFTICVSAVLFGEIISLGTVLGAVLLITGLYCALSGKSKEQSKVQGNCASTTNHTPKSDSARQDEIPVGRTTKQSSTENSCSSV